MIIKKLKQKQALPKMMRDHLKLKNIRPMATPKIHSQQCAKPVAADFEYKEVWTC